jgi:hypothetical protein
MRKREATLKKFGRLLGNSIFLCGLGLFYFSCVSRPNPFAEIDYAVVTHDFKKGIEVLRYAQSKKFPLYNEKKAISLFLDKGLLEHYAGNYRNSSQDLQEAERLIEEAFTKSITAEILSYIANDKTKEYRGEDYEDIYLNVFNALNYYHDNNIEGAMVEIRKISMSSGKLDMLSRKYENTNRSAGNYVTNQFRELGFSVNPNLPQGKAVNFSNSALARYLGALFYLGQGKTDDARIEFAQVDAAFKSNPGIYNFPVPKSVAAAQNIPAGKTRLNIIAFTGLSPIKEESTIPGFFSFFKNTPLKAIQFKLPVLADRKKRNQINNISIEVGSTGNISL